MRLSESRERYLMKFIIRGQRYGSQCIAAATSGPIQGLMTRYAANKIKPFDGTSLA